jgi:hypothetical protein
VLNLLNELIFPNLDTDVVENITTPIQNLILMDKQSSSNFPLIFC